MATFQDKRDPVRLLMRRLGTVGLLTAAIFLAIGDWGIYKKERDSRALRTEAETERAALVDQEGKLRAAVGELTTDRGKEEALREQYDVGKDGERLIVIVDPPEAKPIEATTTFMHWVKGILPFW